MSMALVGMARDGVRNVQQTPGKKGTEEVKSPFA
jgi:hypothetical protein